MNVGIIAEYNPFHLGHRLHIEDTRALTRGENIIALISGSFVQRGEPAIGDKYLRTKMALLNGADMVLELPVAYATASAEVFARGAVETLDKSGIVDILSFGSEAGDIGKFTEAAELLAAEPKEYKEQLAAELKGGCSYAAARHRTLQGILKKDLSFLSEPNNILAVEYLKALLRLNSSIKPVTVRRRISGYNSTRLTGAISSAAAIRHGIFHGEADIALGALPSNCRSLFLEAVSRHKPDIDSYSQILKYILLTKTPQELREIEGISEGLENRILSLAHLGTIREIADGVKSKRYAHSRVRRALLHIILGITKEDCRKEVEYIRVLGFKRSKAHLLSELTEKSAVPVVANVKNAPSGLLDKDIFATDMYYLPLTGERSKDLTEPLVIVE